MEAGRKTRILGELAVNPVILYLTNSKISLQTLRRFLVGATHCVALVQQRQPAGRGRGSASPLRWALRPFLVGGDALRRPGPTISHVARGRGGASPLRTAAPRSLAAAASTAYFAAMNGTPKDIDPSTELIEDDEEQSLPELDPGIDPPAAGGSPPPRPAAILPSPTPR